MKAVCEVTAASNRNKPINKMNKQTEKQTSKKTDSHCSHSGIGSLNATHTTSEQPIQQKRNNPYMKTSTVAVSQIEKAARLIAVATIKPLFALIIAAPACASASNYVFLPITAIGPHTSRFTSPNGNGYIDVTDAIVSGAFGSGDNVNTLWANNFPNLFPGTGLVPGHVARAAASATYTVTFDLSNYTLSSSTVFGLWNLSSNSQADYNMTAFGASGQISPPFTWNLIGNDDNTADVLGRTRMEFDLATGQFDTQTNVINPNGIDSDAAFWDQIDANTRQIVLTGTLGTSAGDGTGSYFAEVVPEPSPVMLGVIGVLGLCFRRIRKSNSARHQV